MRIFSTQEMKERTLSNIIVVASGILIMAFIFLYRDFINFINNIFQILSPFLIAFATAFIVASPMQQFDLMFQKILCKKKPRDKLCRMLAIIICYILLIGLITAFISLVVPQLLSSIRQLSVSVTNYFRNHAQDITALLTEYNITGENPANVLITWETLMSKALDFAGKALLSAVSMSASISNVIVQLFIGLIVSVYMLYDKEHFAAQSKKVAYAFMPIDKVNNIIFWMRRSHSIFSNFIAGKIIETVIVGLVCYVGMSAMRMEYSMLISVIVGITNVIPIFGAFAGGIIGVLILLISNPMHALWFLIFIIVLQQVDGNILAPRILGSSTGLSPFWTVLAIVLGGGLFGVGGMLLCVPVFALIYAILRTVVEENLKKKNMPTSTEGYGKTGTIFIVPAPGDISDDASYVPIQSRPDDVPIPPAPSNPATPRPNRRKRK